jgi:Raf kinase inhibitor-like YbhB/YbcL family protein
MKLTSPAFQHQQRIPAKYTCDGQDINPPLHIAEAPTAAESLVLIMDDPDAPKGTWVHWTVWNMDPRTSEIPENSAPPGAAQGMTGFRRPGYGGPCPPSGTHRYFFKLYALDTKLNLPASTDKAALEEAMEGHVLAHAELVGLYSR